MIFMIVILLITAVMKVKTEMEKHEDAADASVLFFPWLC